MRVAIPSKGRPGFLAKKVFKNPIVFVEPDELQKYMDANINIEIVNIGQNNKGISYARNFILDYMKDNIFCISDDDITGIYIRQWSKFAKMSEVDIMLSEIKHLLKNNDITVLGFPSKAFAWCQKKDFKRNAKILNIIFINGEKIKTLRYDENISHGEDVDFLLQMIRSGRNAYLYNGYTYTNAKSGKQVGGCQGMRNLESMIKDVNYMNIKWGKDTVKAVIKDGFVSHRVRFNEDRDFNISNR